MRQLVHDERPMIHITGSEIKAEFHNDWARKYVTLRKGVTGRSVIPLYLHLTRHNADETSLKCACTAYSKMLTLVGRVAGAAVEGTLSLHLTGDKEKEMPARGRDWTAINWAERTIVLMTESWTSMSKIPDEVHPLLSHIHIPQMSHSLMRYMADDRLYFNPAAWRQPPPAHDMVISCVAGFIRDTAMEGVCINIIAHPEPLRIALAGPSPSNKAVAVITELLAEIRALLKPVVDDWNLFETTTSPRFCAFVPSAAVESDAFMDLCLADEEMPGWPVHTNVFSEAHPQSKETRLMFVFDLMELAHRAVAMVDRYPDPTMFLGRAGLGLTTGRVLLDAWMEGALPDVAIDQLAVANTTAPSAQGSPQHVPAAEPALGQRRASMALTRQFTFGDLAGHFGEY